MDGLYVWQRGVERVSGQQVAHNGVRQAGQVLGTPALVPSLPPEWRPWDSLSVGGGGRGCLVLSRPLEGSVGLVDGWMEMLSDVQLFIYDVICIVFVTRCTLS